jgi:chitinase
MKVVNIMAMDYGNVSNGKTGMGGYAISAAEGLRKQLDKISLQNVKVGITPMIGQNDVASEIFRVEDAKQLAEWAKDTKWVRLLSYWSMNRDYGKSGDLFISSQVKQSKYEFLKTMQKFK